MEVTHLFVIVHLLVGLGALLAHGERNAEAGDVTEAAITEDQQKVYDECRNPDYKKYVKCLMRPKRHGHHTGHGDGLPDTDAAYCLETCLKKCDHHLEHDCEKKCNYCTKRTRHRHQIITEYETECDSGGCNSANDGQRTTNITTNIGINNVINPFAKINGSGWVFIPNGNGTCCKPGEPCKPGFPPCVYPPFPPFSPFFPFSPFSPFSPFPTFPTFPPFPSYSPVPSLPIVPQVSLVPQITYGVGFGAAGGCAYNQWLCVQQSGAQLPSVPDCSGCGNPVLRYKCDVNCYAIYTNTATKLPCKSPDCVGGST